MKIQPVVFFIPPFKILAKVGNNQQIVKTSMQYEVPLKSLSWLSFQGIHILWRWVQSNLGSKVCLNIAIIATMKTGGLWTQISNNMLHDILGTILLPCINMNTENLKILIVAVEKQSSFPSPRGKNSARKGQGISAPQTQHQFIPIEAGSTVDTLSPRFKEVRLLCLFISQLSFS